MVIKTTDVITPITEKTTATKPVRNCLLQTPIRPRMNANGDKIKDKAKIPTNPIINPKSPKLKGLSMMIVCG